jgi:hypothetical protein
MFPSLSTIQKLAARVDGGIAAGDEARAQANLDDASALVRHVARSDYVDVGGNLTDGIPDAIQTVVLLAAKRAFTNPEGVVMGTDGDTTATFGTPDVYLTAKEEQIVRGAVGAGGGVGTLQLESNLPVPASELMGDVLGAIESDVG